MKWSSDHAIGSFSVQFGSYAHGVGVDLRHHVKGAIDLIDSRNVRLYTLVFGPEDGSWLVHIDKIHASKQAAFESSFKFLQRHIYQFWVSGR